MSYQNRIDRMIDGHFAEYQDGLLLGKQLHDCLHPRHLYMPYGYPASVYHPKFFKTPKITCFVHKPQGILSNGVPKVLSGELIDGYLLGVYNPAVH